MNVLCRTDFVRPVAMAVSVALVVSGCATASKDIAAVYVSPNQYASYDCEQLAAESARIQARVVQLGGRLDQAAQNDAGIMAVGLIIFWPALFAIGGTKQQEAEYGRLKGEYDAVEQASITKKCSHIVPSKPITTQQAATQAPSGSPPSAQVPVLVPAVAVVGDPAATARTASQPAIIPTSQPVPVAASASPALSAPSKYLISAERFSKDAGCVGAVAAMNIRAPTYETFTVTCTGGDPRSVRCDDGVCRELK